MTAPRLFGTNGIRGIVGETITSQFAYGIGSSVASLFKSEKILVGRDGRTSSQMLAEGAVAGILALGKSVGDCGVITTPGLQFLAKISTAPGLVITASHNPPEYNGFKIVDSDGIEIPREKEERIENLVTKDSWNVSRIPGQREQRDLPLEPYLSSIKSYVRKEKLTNRLKVTVDTGNGVSSLTTPVLLRRIGCQVVTINDNIDGRFPGRNSEPRPENLGPLSTFVRQEKATFGVAHDGDGDRAVFVDETGAVQSGDNSLTLIADEILNSIIENRMPLSKLMARLPTFFMAKEKRKCPDEKKKDVMKRIRQRLGNRVTSTIDGIRVDIKNRGWFLVRPSGTEPLIRIYVEGRTETDLKQLLDEFKPLFDETIGT